MRACLPPLSPPHLPIHNPRTQTRTHKPTLTNTGLQRPLPHQRLLQLRAVPHARLLVRSNSDSVDKALFPCACSWRFKRSLPVCMHAPLTFSLNALSHPTNSDCDGFKAAQAFCNKEVSHTSAHLCSHARASIHPNDAMCACLPACLLFFLCLSVSPFPTERHPCTCTSYLTKHPSQHAKTRATPARSAGICRTSRS